MYTLNGWWFLSSSGSYSPVFTVVGSSHLPRTGTKHSLYSCLDGLCNNFPYTRTTHGGRTTSIIFVFSLYVCILSLKNKKLGVVETKAKHKKGYKNCVPTLLSLSRLKRYIIPDASVAHRVVCVCVLVFFVMRRAKQNVQHET